MALTDDFAACFGFATAETLSANFRDSQTLQSIVAECTGGRFQECVADSEEWLKAMVSGLFNHLDSNAERLSEVISGLKAESEALPPEARSLHQRFCLILFDQYGNDVGIVFTYLMNIVTPQAG